MSGKASGVKVAPPGHHKHPEDRRAEAMLRKGPAHPDVLRAIERDAMAWAAAEARVAFGHGGGR